MNTVFFINGFLEAGKTTFIKDLLKRDFFKIEEQTLIIACEEGEEEYDKDMKKEIPICRVLELERIDAPEEEIVQQVI